MTDLELLAPARNSDIGIAAIDCGADAVYMAGPKFGARQDAGNSVEDIRRLCDHAHRFGARVFITLNTIVFDDELAQVRKLAEDVEQAGADAVIVQDLALTRMSRLPLHASTQCAIRTPSKAAFYDKLGFSRLVLERELSLDRIKEIREAVDCELEAFVHGALCVCYSGQCYLSESIAGRSANRGECIQACRSLYDLVDEDGKVLARNKALLSLKDLNLIRRLEDLALAGVSSFKIEGRLKNSSYVRNVVRAYSLALDALVTKHPGRFRRSSFGRVEGGFTPELDKTFNRGYTECFLDGVRGSWSSMDAPKSMGEEVGTVVSCECPQTPGTGKGFKPGVHKAPKAQALERLTIAVSLKDSRSVLSNGDGFSFVAKDGTIVGFRGDVCQGDRIQCKEVRGIFPGARLFRNLDSRFERELESDSPQRLVPVSVDISVGGSEGGWLVRARALSEDGRSALVEKVVPGPVAQNQERMRSVFAAQVSKRVGEYSFTLDSLVCGASAGLGANRASGASDALGEGRGCGDAGGRNPLLPLLSAQEINGLRRSLAEKLDALPCKPIPLYVNPNRAACGLASFEASGVAAASGCPTAAGLGFGCQSPAVTTHTDETSADAGAVRAAALALAPNALIYKDNVANSIARGIYGSLGAESIEEAYEISHRTGVELMRTKHCIRHELGLCPLKRRNPAEAQSLEVVGPEAPAGAKRLFLLNNGKRYALSFDCRNCEMVVKEG